MRMLLAAAAVTLAVPPLSLGAGWARRRGHALAEARCWSWWRQAERLGALAFYGLFTGAALALLGPSAWQVLGAAMLVPVACGIVFGAVIAVGTRRHSVGGELFGAFGVGLLLVHSLVDGAALFSFGEPSARQLLAPMLIADRLALGLMTWTILRRTYGVTAGWLGLTLHVLALAVGYELVSSLEVLASTTNLLWWLNALLLGLWIGHGAEHVPWLALEPDGELAGENGRGAWPTVSQPPAGHLVSRSS